MKRSDLARPALFFLISFGLTLVLLAGSSVYTLQAESSLREMATSPSIDPERYREAQQALTAADFDGAKQHLLELAESSADRGLESRIVLGLYAHSVGDHELAVEHLQATAAYRGELSDWRLLTLGESATSLGDLVIAKTAYEQLVGQHVGSPLRSLAAIRLGEQAVERSDWPGVLAAASLAEDAEVESEERERLSMLAWEAARYLQDPALTAHAARRLLVDHPLRAAELDVAEVFRREDGDLPWRSILSPAQLTRRAERLREVGMAESALELLENVAEKKRTVEWVLARARTLTELQRGEEALALLDSVEPADAATAAQFEWERALAALEGATARRGRRHLSAEGRLELRERALQHLRTTAGTSSDPRLTVRALRLLFKELLEDDVFEEALAALVRLKAMDGDDLTGAGALWRRGWREYTERNFTGAIGNWSELADLYPRSNYNRSGLYWSGRAYEQLGNVERAQELYRAVADVEFTDLYRRYALRRLDLAPAGDDDPGQVPSEPWPSDLRLARGERLRRLGLAEMALIEVESLKGTESRAQNALRAHVLADLGRRRESIIALRSAFPLLGTPHQNLVPLEARRMFYPLDYAEVIEKHSRSRGLPSHLVFGMIRQESAFDASAKSWAGARGLMQIMPATGRELARGMGLRYSVDRLSDPEFSVQLGTSYLQQMLDIFEGDDILALAGYNAGPYRIKRLWRQASGAEIDHFVEQLAPEETKTYVKRVLLYADSYRRLYEVLG